MKYFSLKYATLSALVFASSLTPAISAQTLLFKSGFESGTTLGPVTGTAPNGPNETITGTDSSTGFAWSTLPFGPNPSLTGIHIIPPHASTDANSSHFFNILDSSTVHSGTQSLKLNMTGYPDNNCCSQNVFNMIGMSQSVTSLYMRLWMKLGPEVATQLATHKNQFWRDVFEIKTTNDYRIISYVFGDSSGKPYWSAHADNNPNNTYPPNGSPITFWQQQNTTVPVPLSNWFEVEVYLKRSTGSDGVYQMAINGTTIVSQAGANYGSNQEKINQWMFANSYGPFNPQSQWIDDVELWSTPPCGSFPCGSGTTTEPPPTTPPTITSTSLPAATVGTAYSQAISATGTTPLVWAVTSGTLPSGLALNSSGTVSGTPAASGSSSFTLQASNAMGSTSKQFSLTINPKTTTSSWFELVSKNSSKCLDVPGASLKQDVQLQQYTCSGADNQKFQLTPVTGGYKVTNKHSGLGVNIRYGTAQNGAAVIQWPYSGEANEIWNTHPNVDGSYTLTVNSSGKCMDVVGQSTKDGALIQQWQCTGVANQKWSLVPVQ